MALSEAVIMKLRTFVCAVPHHSSDLDYIGVRKGVKQIRRTLSLVTRLRFNISPTTSHARSFYSPHILGLSNNLIPQNFRQAVFACQCAPFTKHKRPYCSPYVHWFSTTHRGLRCIGKHVPIPCRLSSRPYPTYYSTS